MKFCVELIYCILFLTKILCCLTFNINFTDHQKEMNSFVLKSMENEVPLILKEFYKTNEIYEYLENLQNQGFDFIDIFNIGYTKRGTPLKIIHIKPDNNLTNKNMIWIDGGIHAREWITISSVIYIANELINNRDNLPKYMRNIHFVLMPIVNPDGYTYTHEKDRMWRKNYAETENKDCIGIDLNRNWDYDWNSTYSEKNSCSNVYRGPVPNSELEIKAIIKFIEKNVDDLKGFITFHAYGQSIMYPWAYTNAHLEDYNDHYEIATSMADEIFKKTSKNYSVGSVNTIMRTNLSGTSIDWIKGTAKVKYVFTLELRDTGRDGFKLSRSEIIPTGQEALCAVSILTKHIVVSKGIIWNPMHYYYCITLYFVYFLFKY